MESLRIMEDCRKIMRRVFKLIKEHPEHRYSINDQLIRSTLSIGSNLAEGNMRRGQDRKHFFDIALGSLEESRFQLSVYPDFDFLEFEEVFNKIRGTIMKLQDIKHQSSSPSSSPSPSESSNV